MKKLLIIISITLILVNCKKKEEPTIPEPETSIDKSNNQITINDTFVFEGDYNKKVFIEGFLGYKCVNCPYGYDFLNDIITDYPGEIIGISHYGNYFSQIDTTFPCSIDLYNTSSKDYNTYFNINLYPCFLIDRKKYSSAYDGEYLTDYHKLENYFLLERGQTSNYKIKLRFKYDATSGILLASGEVNNSTSSTNDIAMILMVKEKELTGCQLDTNGIWNSNYIHINPVREIVETWGDTLLNVTGTSYFPFHQININWNANNSKLVGVLYDVNTKEVLQVEETSFVN